MARGSPQTGPGPVAAVHRLLIATGLAGALVYVAWELREYARDGAAGSLVVASLALTVAGGLAVYLRTLRGLAARLTPPRDGGGTR